MIFVNNVTLFLSCLHPFFRHANISSNVKSFLSQSQFSFCCESFYFPMRISLLLWEFFFCPKNFSFAVRLLLLLWEFSFSCDNSCFALRIFLHKYKLFSKPYKKGCGWLCSFSFAVRIFLSLWEFFFFSENFHFAVRIFLLHWEFFCTNRNFLVNQTKKALVGYIAYA